MQPPSRSSRAGNHPVRSFRCRTDAVARARLCACRKRAYVIAHATSVGDAGERAALRPVLGERGPANSSTKSAIGHPPRRLLCAAGGLEAVIILQALRAGVLPALNLTDPDKAAAGLDLIGPAAQRASVDHALSNGFGFGDVSASIVLKRMAAGRDISALGR